MLDVASYYLGLVIPAYRDPEKAFLELPFRGTRGQIAARVMKFYNRRLVALAKRRLFVSPAATSTEFSGDASSIGACAIFRRSSILH